MSKLLQLIVLLLVTSCTLSGHSNDGGVYKYITGATKVDEVKDVHVINIFRAIGTPNNSMTIGRFKYYQWDYSRIVGINTILGGGSTTFYCKLSAETQGNKIKTLNWYGNQCDIFLDQINEYFKNKLNIVIITDEDSKQQVSKPEPKEELKIETLKPDVINDDSNSQKTEQPLQLPMN